MNTQKTGLPYVDNARAVLITLAINLGVVVLLHRSGVSYCGVLWDSFFCALVTTAVDMRIVHARMKRMRALGEIPLRVPESPFMQRLPQNPLALGAVYAFGFGVLAVGANALLLRFFGIAGMAFVPWMLYKLVYATVLSIKVTEFCIFRYVQPDWAGVAATTAHASTPVKNPLPRIGLFKEMFGSVTGNIAMNILIGSILGGVRVGEGGWVLIAPTTVEGIPITGLVFGLITGVLVSKGVLGEMNAAILASGDELSETAASDWRFAWMPVRRWALTSLICACVMAFSAVVLPAIMRLFGLSLLNFYQFCVLITVYAALVGKPISYVLLRRAVQPDYIRSILNGAEIGG